MLGSEGQATAWAMSELVTVGKPGSALMSVAPVTTKGNVDAPGLGQQLRPPKGHALARFIHIRVA